MSVSFTENFELYQMVEVLEKRFVKSVILFILYSSFDKKILQVLSSSFNNNMVAEIGQVIQQCNNAKVGQVMHSLTNFVNVPVLLF